MIMKNRLIIAALTIVAMVGCQKETGSIEEANSNGVIEFSSSSIATRVTDMNDGDGGTVDAWEDNDRIGVTTDGYLANGFAEEHFNEQLAAVTDELTESVKFEVMSDDVKFLKPNSMTSPITYYAYYPYTENVDEDGGITVDISNQGGENEDKNNNPGKVDFMVAATKTETPTSSVSFEFGHKLAKVIFSVTLNDEVTIRDEEATIADLAASMTIASTTAVYDKDGNYKSYEAKEATIDLTTDGKGTVTAIVHPNNTTDNEDHGIKSITFELNGYEYILDASSLEFAPNKIYTFNVTLGKTEVIFTGESTIEDWGSVDGSAIEGYDDLEGDGTRNNPYQIYTADDFLAIGDGYADSHYILMADIEITTESEVLFDKLYINDGYDSETNTFEGTLNGDNHTITFSSEKAVLVLFDIIGTNGKVTNLNIMQSGEDTELCIPYIANDNYGVIENCTCNGSSVVVEPEFD